MSMQILLMGPPGAGKGTQAKMLCQRFGLVHLATGDILREEVRAGTDLGKSAKSYMERGDLVPDSLINEMMQVHMGRNLATGFLLDGYPRTRPQAEEVEAFLAGKRASLGAVLRIEVDEESLIERIVHRVSCQACGAVYNRRTRPPRVEGRCDACQGALKGRSDDTEETIRNRLKVYRGETEPVVGYFRERGLEVQDVDGNAAIDSVQAALVGALEAAGTSSR